MRIYLNILFNHWVSFGLVITMLVLASSCKKEQAVPANPDELVKIGDDSITVQDLKREMDIFQREKRPVSSDLDLLKQMVEFKSQVQKARALKLDEDPAVKRQIEKVLVTALHNKQASQLQEGVSEEEVKAVYDADIDKYTRAAMDRFAMLYLKLEKNASETKRAEIKNRMIEARAKALALAERTVGGSAPNGFGKLSLTYSDDTVSRYRGGDIGWSFRDMPSQRVPEEVWKVGVALEKDELSEIIETSDGIYLIMRTDFRAAKITPFERVSSQIRRRLEAERRAAQQQTFVNSCVEWASPVRNEARIRQLSDQSNVKPKVVKTNVPAMGVPHE